MVFDLTRLVPWAHARPHNKHELGKSWCFDIGSKPNKPTPKQVTQSKLLSITIQASSAMVRHLPIQKTSFSLALDTSQIEKNKNDDKFI